MNIAAAAGDPAELPRYRLACPQPARPTPTDARAVAASGIALNYQGGRSVQQRQKSWTGVSASVAQVHCDDELHVDLGGDAARLSVVLERVGGRMDIRSKECRGHSPAGGIHGPLSVIPAGLQAHGTAKGLRFLRHLVVQFDLAALVRMAEDEIDPAMIFAPRLMFADPGIVRLAQLFGDDCVVNAPYSRLYGDTLSIALLFALSRACGAQQRPVSLNGRLAPWQLRRVSEYMNEHLTEDVKLHTLSELVNLSRSYFSRAFKISTGLTPHQWLLQARIAKAKQLMLEGDFPLARIAIEVGFADQGHFTRTFGRAVGESPGAWRRDRLPDR